MTFQNSLKLTGTRIFFKGSFLFALLILSPHAFGYLENSSHGYANCMSCHVSPNGGGLLTDYGRSLSKELMSTWGWEGSQAPLFGAIKQTNNFKVGGDIRTLQTHFENDQLRQGKFFLMQQNLELAYKYASTWFVGTVGTNEGPDGTLNRGTFLSERHFIIHKVGENSYLRAGKFRVSYGLNDPNHARVTEQGIGFGSQTEMYNLELDQFFDEGELFVGASLGRFDLPREQTSEKSFYTRYNHYFKGKNQLGGNLLVGESPTKRRSLLGVFAVLTPIDDLGVVTEWDYERAHLSTSPSDRVEGIFTASRVLYEVYQGVKPYVVFEAQQPSLKDHGTQSLRPGLGVQWIPIPHFEIQSEYQRITTDATGGSPTHSAWLMLHFWL